MIGAKHDVIYFIPSLILDGQPFYRGRVITDGGKCEALVFLSPTLSPELANMKDVQADATFRTLPKHFKQLFTIHLSCESKV